MMITTSLVIANAPITPSNEKEASWTLKQLKITQNNLSISSTRLAIRVTYLKNFLLSFIIFFNSKIGISEMS
jgi:hypothetical protein